MNSSLLRYLQDNTPSVAGYTYCKQLETLATFPTKGQVACHAKQWPTTPSLDNQWPIPFWLKYKPLVFVSLCTEKT